MNCNTPPIVKHFSFFIDHRKKEDKEKEQRAAYCRLLFKYNYKFWIIKEITKIL